MTRLERLAPSITSLAAVLGDTVHYHGGDYFLVNCQRSLWNSRRDGALTVARAAEAADALRMLVAHTADARAKPLVDRALVVVEMLRTARWIPGHFTEVTTEALDRGILSYWLGAYSFSVHVMGQSAEVRDIRDRNAALDALTTAVRAKWGSS